MLPRKEGGLKEVKIFDLPEGLFMRVKAFENRRVATTHQALKPTHETNPYERLFETNKFFECASRCTRCTDMNQTKLKSRVSKSSTASAIPLRAPGFNRLSRRGHQPEKKAMRKQCEQNKHSCAYIIHGQFSGIRPTRYRVERLEHGLGEDSGVNLTRLKKRSNNLITSNPIRNVLAKFGNTGR
jgi:hypothetical protein